MTLGSQFGDIMDSVSDELVVKAGFPIAEEITAKMKELTKSGKGFDNRYDTPYQQPYARKRKRAGLQTQAVELRFKGLRIERTTQPQNVGGGAEIGFVDGGEIFKYHQDGVKYKNGLVRTRTIFPRDWDSVPQEIYDRFISLIMGVVRG
jgi:hypothetical protein